MLLTQDMALQFREWNSTHKAPFGPPWWRVSCFPVIRRWFWNRGLRFYLPAPLIRRLGHFAFQENSVTREVEYPWCWEMAGVRPGMNVLEIGGGASGFQFSLACAGAKVTSVDPLVNPSSSIEWTFDERHIHRLAKAFKCKIDFKKSDLKRAQIASNSCDLVFAISVIEHLPAQDRSELISEIERILKPGGLFVATIDLFLKLAPFTSVARNEYGENISVRELAEGTGLKMVRGNPQELIGYREFTTAAVEQMRGRFYESAQAVASQAFVLQKPLDTAAT